ncbi:MAG TPA: hypothetical protein VKV03_15120 [Candidatus Binataceae bacterium]|nr:hypothetical protein [Candidatus Binataceae bacterium]
MFFLAKTLEAIGCVDVLFALWVGISEPHGMGREFEMTGVGILVFVVGVAIEHYFGEQL